MLETHVSMTTFHWHGCNNVPCLLQNLFVLLLFSEMLKKFWLFFCNVDDVYNVLALLFRSATPHSWIPPTSYQLNGYWVLGSFGQKIHPNNISVSSLRKTSGFDQLFKVSIPGRILGWQILAPPSILSMRGWCPECQMPVKADVVVNSSNFIPFCQHTKAFPPNKNSADLNTNWAF